MTKTKPNINRLILIAGVLAVAAAAAVLTLMPRGGSGAELNLRAAAVTDADIVISLRDVTENARFYPAVIDGTQLEIIAVKAPDGTVRTAFNTCQSCYGSGRGYYVQSGGVLVCQNCRNEFTMSQVEVRAGGCNPVPIFAADKEVSGDSITVPVGFLRDSAFIFGNWKA
ncbi:MAG: DUF2318 domain-containing protein [Oscillospiraceae bacterium]|jgi:uncharacterized membrane protein|nr:DUF2318 domain-containing protein [Oscillospiraceae bacterium]